MSKVFAQGDPPKSSPRPRAQMTWRSGATKGIAAGALFAVVQMIAALFAGESLLVPWRMAASVVLGSAAITPLGAVSTFVIGFLVHFALSAIFGLGYSLIMNGANQQTRVSAGREAAIGVIYGLALWLLNFQLIARVMYPWFLSLPQFLHAVLHAFAFGLPLALIDVAVRRRAPSGVLRYSKH